MDRMLAERILAASGAKKASLVLKHARIVNVFSAKLETGDIAIEDGCIVGVGDYEGQREIELGGLVVCPGLIDGHIHMESSMVAPEEFERSVVPHGTQAVITDPHEIANVAGVEGISFMMERTSGLILDVYFMLPSCVPSTGLDESGAVLTAEKLAPLYGEKRVLGLAELMNSYGTIRADREILEKVEEARKRNLLIDGHAPGLSGRELNAYITAGVRSDHECSNAEEAMEKIGRGQWVMIREGTAARNLEALLPLFEEPYYRRCMLVTDDRHPGDLIRLGHLDYIIKKAVSLGADPIHAVMMGSFHAAQYFGLPEVGAIAPGYKANFMVVSDLKDFCVRQVYKDGKLVAENGVMKTEIRAAEMRNAEMPVRVGDSFRLKEIRPEDFRIEKKGAGIRVLCLTPGELTTRPRLAPWVEKEGFAPGVCVEQDIVKMAVLERHQGTGHIGLGFLGGYGLKRGAVATSIAHDSHNLIIAGTNDIDMALAGNAVRKNRGGLAVAAGGKVLGELPLPIAGLMSEEPAEWVDEKLEELKARTRELGIGEGIDPFMTLAFASLPVIPKLRLNTYGLIDVEEQKIADVMISCISKNTDNQ
ncbi:adenine deaminase [Clostridium sp. Marseille-P2415]|uniref:adenine deaminase n=1 Tax=Clostridium sp. Marseille-P2415 TaxID=1805471 RepID=UPI0009885DB6|nr:adenine deaminase [Clostridium sp. Marseille-P2415]